MICPYCALGVGIEWEEAATQRDPGTDQFPTGHQLLFGVCPECDNLVVLIQVGPCTTEKGEFGLTTTLTEVADEFVVFPRSAMRPIPAEVPTQIRDEFLEAAQVLKLSPKASAALSRRLLQRILREHFKLGPSSLDQEISHFLGLPGIPSYLTKAVDGVRNIGNFAAHPLKDTNTGEIVDVEPGEAEWLLDVLESLLDYSYVQPSRLEEHRIALDKKLAGLGKPPMKGKTSA